MPLRQLSRCTRRTISAHRCATFDSVSTIRSLGFLSRQQIVVPPKGTSRRHLTTPPPQMKDSDIDTLGYQLYSDATMEKMLTAIEDLLDIVGDPEYEVEYGSGVLTLKLGRQGTYVINKQPPNKQIWLSSPFSGPKRYDYVPRLDQWIYSRDQGSLNDLLNQELSEALGRKVDLGLTDITSLT